MKERLAERLLARVMDWTQEDVARERPIIQAMAAYKYDEYQQFYPGLRFIESLALWLNDIKDPIQKAMAYTFVKERLVFFSSAELSHLIDIAYPDFIRPRLMNRVASQLALNPYHRRKLQQTEQFRIHQRSSLFLGLSDGARTDLFRRANEGVITHEQVLQTHEIKPERINKLLEKLLKDVRNISPEIKETAHVKFRTLVLLDDFSGSGTSYLRIGENGELEGKLLELFNDISDQSRPMAELVDIADVHVMLVLYIATQQALEHLTMLSGSILDPKTIPFEIIAVHPLNHDIRIGPGDSLEAFLTENYRADELEDEHTKKGGGGIKFGYGNCGLPVVLSHNTPNNSIYPLWARTSVLRALFPRVIRHKKS